MKHARSLVSALALLTIGLAGCGVHSTGLTAAQAGRMMSASAHRPVLKGAPASYYAAAEGQTGRALLAALNRIVSAHKDLGYDQARELMFKDIDDPDNDNTVLDIYLGRAMDNVSGKDSAYHNGNGMNAEHTWPQSKGAEGAAKADLHHLFPADVKANSTRGSFPFGDVKTPDWSEGGSVRGTNADGVTVFQPRAPQRGDTARAIFYFYTVYGVNRGLDTSNFRVEEPTLKRWSQEDPVDAREASRNDLIMGVQGNRNPFVDHPEWIQTVGVFLGGDKVAR